MAKQDKHRFLAEDGALYTIIARVVAIMRRIGYRLSQMQDDFGNNTSLLHFGPRSESKRLERLDEKSSSLESSKAK